MIKKAVIYIIKNLINNKVYVGSTSKSFCFRKKQHVNLLNRGKHENSYLQNSWNKHGENNFEFLIVNEFEEIELKELLFSETMCMDEYKSSDRNFGYNICKEGKSQLGRKWSETSKAKRSGAGNPMYGKGHLRVGKLNPMFGRPVSNETRLKIGIKSKGHKNYNINAEKPVIQYDLQGDFINEYKSGIEAFRVTKIRHINEVCHGERKSAGGFKWDFKK